jgi:ribonuclease VapC
MVIDASALIAIFLGEPERETFIRAIQADPVRLISAATFLESAIVLDNRADKAWQLETFIEAAAIEVVPVTAEHARIARVAFREFGKGKHKASLNFGDCFSYALAKSSGEPLLQKGGDFNRTDLKLL